MQNEMSQNPFNTHKGCDRDGEETAFIRAECLCVYEMYLGIDSVCLRLCVCVHAHALCYRNGNLSALAPTVQLTTTKFSGKKKENTLPKAKYVCWNESSMNMNI